MYGIFGYLLDTDKPKCQLHRPICYSFYFSFMCRGRYNVFFFFHSYFTDLVSWLFYKAWKVQCFSFVHILERNSSKLIDACIDFGLTNV